MFEGTELTNGEAELVAAALKHGRSLLPFLYNMVLEVLAIVIRQKEKEIKSLQIGREEAKLPLFADAMILHIENSKVSTKNLLQLTN